MAKKKAEYTTVHVAGRTLRVAQELSPSTNAARGFCNGCSGNGSTRDGRKVIICGLCNGTGRA